MPLSEEDALLFSSAVQARASAEGFDWPEVAGVLSKVEEELDEIREALERGDDAHARRELGDLLLIAVNLARFLGADPREELLSATHRFSNRYACLKATLQAEGKNVGNCSLDDLEARWQEVKPGADKLLSGGA